MLICRKIIENVGLVGTIQVKSIRNTIMKHSLVVSPELNGRVGAVI